MTKTRDGRPVKSLTQTRPGGGDLTNAARLARAGTQVKPKQACSKRHKNQPGRTAQGNSAHLLRVSQPPCKLAHRLRELIWLDDL